MATRLGYDKGTTLSPSKAPGKSSKYNSNIGGGTGRPSGRGDLPAPKMTTGVGAGKGDMFSKEHASKVSSKTKKFNRVGPSRKPFGFGKQQSHGMKGRATQYGNV